MQHISAFTALQRAMKLIQRPLCFTASTANKSYQSILTRTNFCHQSRLPRFSSAKPHLAAIIYATAKSETTKVNISPEEKDGLLPFPSEDDDEEEETLMLQDPHTNRELEVGIEGVIVIDGNEYLVVYPINDAVTVAMMRSDGALDAIEDPTHLVPAARAALEQEKRALVESAYVLTVDDDDALDEEILAEGEDDEDEEEVEENFEHDEDAVEVLAEFAHEGHGYVVARALSATVLIARQCDDGAYVALVGDELERLTPQIDEQMARWPVVKESK